jgi:hypothetical protein
VREQLEHDRVIRLLQARWRRRYTVGINPGTEQTAAVGNGPVAVFPDLVLASLARGRRLEAVVEVETGESVNNLEAMAQWAHLARLRADFFLFVPAGSVESARRLCGDNGIPVSEIWSYHAIGDQMRFTQVYKAPAEVRAAARRAARRAQGPAKRRVAARSAAKPSKRAAKQPPARRARPARRKAAGSRRATRKK